MGEELSRESIEIVFCSLRGPATCLHQHGRTQFRETLHQYFKEIDKSPKYVCCADDRCPYKYYAEYDRNFDTPTKREINEINSSTK